MINHRLAIVAITYVILVCVGLKTGAATDQVAPPAEDETLIYVLREGRLAGSGGRMWIAVNNQTVARVKNKGHAIIRAKAGRISLNMATGGLAVAQIGLDDRAGETVYLKWRLGDREIREVNEEEGEKFLRKSKRTDPIEAPLPNSEEINVLLNLSKLGFELMRSSAQTLQPDDEHSVVTILRRNDGKQHDFGIWSQYEFLGTLKVNQGLQFRVPAGEHFFMAGHQGTTLLKAQVEAGKRYYARLDFGKMIERVRLTPISTQRSDKLDGWLKNVKWVELDPDALTRRVLEREEIVTNFVRSAGQRAGTGDADFHLLGSEHAY